MGAVPYPSSLPLTGGLSLAPTVTLPDVELVATGSHAAVSGPCELNRADLESMLAAALDPEVDAAPLHPGHFDPRFPLADGEPAMGWVRATRIEDRPDGTSVLRGDLTGLPAKL